MRGLIIGDGCLIRRIACQFFRYLLLFTLLISCEKHQNRTQLANSYRDLGYIRSCLEYHKENGKDFPDKLSDEKLDDMDVNLNDWIYTPKSKELILTGTRKFTGEGGKMYVLCLYTDLKYGFKYDE